MGSIYKITNKITGEIYIGQTRYKVERRWYNEKQASISKGKHNYYTKLSKNFREYGVDNFTFEVIEECDNDLLNERERYWIKYYNSYLEGLNMTEGGDYAPICQKIPPQMLENIYQDLRENKFTQKEIAIIYSLSKDTVCGINTGRCWRKDDVDYPIRKFNILTELSKPNKEKEEKEKQQRQLERKNKTDEIYSQEAKLEYAKRVYESSFRTAASFYNITDNALRKRCARLGLPTHTKELKEWYIVNVLKQELPKKEEKKSRFYKVLQLNKDGEIIAEYDSPQDAALALGNIDYRSHIAAVCRGERASAYGYKWRKKDN